MQSQTSSFPKDDKMRSIHDLDDAVMNDKDRERANRISHQFAAIGHEIDSDTVEAIMRDCKSLAHRSMLSVDDVIDAFLEVATKS